MNKASRVLRSCDQGDGADVERNCGVQERVWKQDNEFSPALSILSLC